MPYIGREYVSDRSINSIASNLCIKTKKRTTRGFHAKKLVETRIAKSCKVLLFIHLSPGRRRNRRLQTTAAVFYRVPDNSGFFLLKFERKVLLSSSIRRTWTILILRLLWPQAPLTTSSMSHKSRSIVKCRSNSKL